MPTLPTSPPSDCPGRAPEETWREVDDAGDYLVSNLGRVYSRPRTVVDRRGIPRTLKGRVLLARNVKGYAGVTLRANGANLDRYVHRLVAFAFLGDPGTGYEVNHIDGDRLNNRADNLQWVTSAENTAHGYRNGLIPRGSAHERSLLTENQVRRIRELLADGVRPADVAAKFGVSVGAIYSIRSRKNWAWLD